MPSDAPQAREICVPDPAGAWERLGFAVEDDGSFHVGGVRIVCGRDRIEVVVEGLRADHPDGLAIARADRLSPPSRIGVRRRQHANGVVVLDHVVAFTDALPRTLAALEEAGLEVRRIREPPEAPARQAFLRLGELILEVVETGTEPRLWGLVAVVEDLDNLGDLVGTARDAVQPGRRIATVRTEAGLTTALAFMTPRGTSHAPLT